MLQILNENHMEEAPFIVTSDICTSTTIIHTTITIENYQQHTKQTETERYLDTHNEWIERI